MGVNKNKALFEMIQKSNINGLFIINGYSKNGKDVSSTIRAVYGKCGFDSVFVQTGHGITGIIEVYD